MKKFISKLTPEQHKEEALKYALKAFSKIVQVETVKKESKKKSE